MMKLAYATFGREPPNDLVGPRAIVIRICCALFLVAAIASTIVLNFFSLIVGTLILFVGRPGVEFRFLRLFDQIPVIGMTLPILLGFVIWRQSQSYSVLWAVGVVLAMWLLGTVLLLLAGLWNRTIENWQRRH